MAESNGSTSPEVRAPKRLTAQQQAILELLRAATGDLTNAYLQMPCPVPVRFSRQVREHVIRISRATNMLQELLKIQTEEDGDGENSSGSET